MAQPPSTMTPVPDWKLEPIMGPAIPPLPLKAPGPLSLGRALDCDLRMPESERTVSRQHAKLRLVGGQWLITDLDSTHGTFLNGDRLPGKQERPLAVGDRLRLGPWTFRVNDGRASTYAATIIDEIGAGERLVALEVRTSQIQRRRLELLLDAAKKIAAAEDAAQLGEVVLRMLQEGAGYSLAAMVRPGALMTPASPIEVVVSKLLGSRQSQTGLVISRQLVYAACTQRQIVSLSRDVGSTAGSMHTLADAGVRNAMCVPVTAGNETPLCLYLDSLHSDRPPEEDAGAFCQAVADLCALALANMQRARLEQERVADAKEKQAALEIQRGILPPSAGQLGPVRYAMLVQPGRQVSGDLFDILPLDDGRVGFFVGDVTGKGVPAAILAATTQSYLSAALRHHGCPERAVNIVNQHLCLRTAGQKFVTLWCGVVDPQRGTLRCVDAGHGYAMLVPPGADPSPIDAGGGLPLRVSDEAYTAAEIPIQPGSRLVLYSDGVAEQPAAAEMAKGKRDQFGLERVVATLKECREPQQDVDRLVAAVLAFAGIKRGEPLADDLTVASMELTR